MGKKNKKTKDASVEPAALSNVKAGELLDLSNGDDIDHEQTSSKK
jgi:hypothetical protein